MPASRGCGYSCRDSDSHRDRDGVETRLNCQLGASLVILPIVWGVPPGTSHGVGHIMGPVGVGYGDTSCILLPAVCKYNARATEEKQARIREVLCDIPLCRGAFLPQRPARGSS